MLSPPVPLLIEMVAIKHHVGAQPESKLPPINIARHPIGLQILWHLVVGECRICWRQVHDRLLLVDEHKVKAGQVQVAGQVQDKGKGP